MSDFIPQADDKFGTWLTNFKTKLQTHASTLGIADADLAIYENQIDAMLAANQAADSAYSTYQHKVKTKQQTRNDTESNLRNLAKRIKTHANYTAAIGADLSIVGSTPTVNWGSAKPQLTISNTGGHVIIKFVRGQSNGVKIYGKRGSETAFSFLALDTHSPYHDNRPNLIEGSAETRQYYALFIDSTDNTVGQQSDTVSISL